MRWYEETNGKAPSPVSRHEIPIEEVEAALKAQGTSVRQGDILIVRSGYVRWHKYVHDFYVSKFLNRGDGKEMANINPVTQANPSASLAPARTA